MAKRVFLVVLDSFGIGEASDASAFNDQGSNTLAAVLSNSNDFYPNLARMGLFDIDGHKDPRIVNFLNSQSSETLFKNRPIGSFGRIKELSMGKDSTIGHWEIGGVYSSSPLPTYPDGFSEEILNRIKNISGRDILCNKPYSGTEVIKDYGEEHMKTGALIVYTSADSVLQIAAHEDIVPLDELYSICEKTREIMTGNDSVGRVIARPFTGSAPDFTRTPNRHDYSLSAPAETMLDIIKSKDLDVISIGKIYDLYAGKGITKKITTKNNTDGISKLIEMTNEDFNGLCFINLVDFDMKYGHRNDIEGYATAMHEFDDALGDVLLNLKQDDLLIITADHGCDPSTISTDHSRENVPLLIYGDGYDVPNNMGSIAGFGIVSNIIFSALLREDHPIPYAHDHKLDDSNLMSYVDLTNLKVTATEEDIKNLIDKAIANNCASVCVQPCYVRFASDYANSKLDICTVIGFPNGYQTTAVKKFEAIDACNNGASEIDMVINVALVKSGHLDQVADEIGILAKAVHERGAILKVIIENCYLTRAEKIALCHVVTVQGADFIKTSTGFGTSGATVEDVRLMRHTCGPMVEVKAAGGIRTKELATEMINAGATRIGASNLGD